jgi:uncharacterized membrane protein YhaH (DUF805 family)
VEGAVRAVLRRLFDFKGQAPRKEFWAYYLGLGVASMVLDLPLVIWTVIHPAVLAERFGSVQGVQWILQAPVVVAAIALFFRRLHDRGRLGFWFFLPLAVFAGSSWWAGSDGLRSIIAAVVCVPMFSWLLIELGFLPSTGRQNSLGAKSRVATLASK